MSIPVAKGTPVSRAGSLIVQILTDASMAHGTSIRIEKRQFRPGAGGNNRRSQPSNPLVRSGMLGPTPGDSSPLRRLQQLVLGRLRLLPLPQAQLFPACERRIYWVTRKSSASYNATICSREWSIRLLLGAGRSLATTTRNWVAYVSHRAPKQMYR
jgi:hypothetical protein